MRLGHWPAGLVLVCALSGHWHVAAADLTSFSLEQLLQTPILGASKYEQKQSEVGAAVRVITRQDIKDFGWRTLAEALASLPGVHTTYDRQYTYLGMRGFGLPGDLTVRVLVTIDGNRVNDPVFDSAPPGREFPLDLEMVERIEFLPGPGGAIYGQNAMFGVVNVVTRTGARVDGASVAMEYQRPQGLRNVSVSWGKLLDNGLDVLLSASGTQAQGEDRFFNYGLSGVSGVARGLDGERDNQFFARISGGAWMFQLVHGDRRKDDPTGLFQSDPLVAGQYQADRYDLLQLKYEKSFAADTLHLSGRLFSGAYRFRGDQSYGNVIRTLGDGDWAGGEVRLLTTALANHKLMIGLEAQNNRRVDQAVLYTGGAASDIRIPLSGYRVGVFAQDEWRISPTLSATLGLRLDRDKGAQKKASPRLALIWEATPDSTLKGLVGTAHRAPNAYEKYYNDGVSAVSNPALTGETIATRELVIDHRAAEDLGLRASVYRWNMRDLIVQGIDPVSGLSQFQSGGDVRSRGVELSAEKAWRSGARLRGSVAFQKASHASGGELPNSPRVMGRAEFSGALPGTGLRLGYELQYDGKRLSLDGTRLGGYAISNLNLSSTALAPGVDLSVRIVNLFDKRYSVPGASTNWQNAFEQDGRSLSVKIVFGF